MIEGIYDEDNNCIDIKFSGQNFLEIVDILKDCKLRFDSKKKIWPVPIGIYDYVKRRLVDIEPISIDTWSQEMLAKSKQSLNEVVCYRHVFHPELLKLPPLQGKDEKVKNFQLEDITKGLCHNRFIYHHEVGLGKSYILTALIEHKRMLKEVDRCLIFSTNIGVRNLKNEILKFSTTLIDDDIVAYPSVPPKDERHLFDKDIDILIMSYDVLKSIASYYGKELLSKVKFWLRGNPGGLFLDECHALSNPKSERTKTLNNISKLFFTRYLFSGTLADKYEKLYEPAWLIEPALVNGLNYFTWLSTVNNLGTSFSKYAINPKGWDEDKLLELTSNLSNYVSERKMIDCLDLPDAIEKEPIICELSNKHKEIYEAVCKAALNDFNSAEGKKGLGVVLNIAQTASDNPSALTDGEIFAKLDEDLQNKIKSFNYTKDCDKANVLKDIIDDELDTNKDRKGIIWYYHPATKDSLLPLLEKYGVCVVGAEVPMDKRNDIINEFKTNKNKRLLLASIFVASTSVTIVEAKYEVYTELTYNYTVYTQSRGRIHRPGKNGLSYTYFLRNGKTSDGAQTENLKMKGALLDSLFKNKNAYIAIKKIMEGSSFF